MNHRENPLVIVSGLPRSGTSLMMQMLEAGGLPPMTDQIRQADENNPRGYYEWEAIKQLPENPALILEARGKATKVISMLLHSLPSTETYQILFMNREIAEVEASQRAMLQRIHPQSSTLRDSRMQDRLQQHREKMNSWAQKQPNMCILDVSYPDLISTPEKTVQQICAFLQHPLDPLKMASVIDPSLYRQRK